jgi:type III secretion protein J
MRPREFFIRLLAPLLCLLVAACGDQTLYSDLKESQANEMVAVLQNADIAASKQTAGEGTWSVTVSPENFSQAAKVLQANGLPRDEFATLGDIFAKKGFVSSPTEERARLIYGLSQELSATVSQIDGVLEARVHLAIPEHDPLSDEVKPSSAAVFIKYQPGFDLRSQTGPIKSLVTNSIEGLSYDKVSVVMFPSQPASASQDVSAGWIGQPVLVVVLALLGVAGLGVALFGRWRSRRTTLPQVTAE